MDWDLAIRRNRDQLRQIVLALFALAGLRGGGLSSPLSKMGERPLAQRGGEGAFTIFPLFLPRSTIALIMLVLRPAESAVRRLIVIVAQGMKLISLAKSAAALTSPLGGEVPGFAGRRGAYRAFPLFDPLKSFDPDSIWDAEPVFESDYSLTKSTVWHDASSDSTPVDATHLALRLNAILRALNDLPRQARRLKRWELKRDTLLRSLTLRCDPDSGSPRRAIQWRPTRLCPMRPGLPPGWRERRLHEIHDVLKECHRLAIDRLDSG